jgi:hypothetical protein
MPWHGNREGFTSPLSFIKTTCMNVDIQFTFKVLKWCRENDVTDETSQQELLEMISDHQFQLRSRTTKPLAPESDGKWRLLRLGADLTIDQVAAFTGLGQGYLSQLERGFIRDPRPARRKFLEDFYATRTPNKKPLE